MQIRPARPEDALGIATVHVRSWQETYRGALPQPFLDALDPAAREPSWRRILTAGRPRSATLVAEEDGAVLGFADTCPSRDPDLDPADSGEVTSIYLLPRIWGHGYGRGLMSAALDTLSAVGFRQAGLWVLDRNVRAIRFYAAGGWRADGAVKNDLIGETPVTELRYLRSLSTG